MNVSSSLSGIKASFTREAVSAHDVANINTPKFKQRDVIQTENTPNGTQISGIVQSKSTGTVNSNTDLAEETKEQIISKESNSANIAVIKTKNKMLGDLLDLIG